MKERVKDLLRSKGMTAKDLAGQMGISESALSLSLNGNPTLSRLQEVAAALGVEVSELFAPKGDFVAFVKQGENVRHFDDLNKCAAYLAELKAGNE